MFSETDHRVNTPKILINNLNNEEEHTPSWFVDDMKQGVTANTPQTGQGCHVEGPQQAG